MGKRLRHAPVTVTVTVIVLGIVGGSVVACSTTSSPPSGAASCTTADGKTYSDGQSVPSPDKCNTCGCNAGVVACTAMACAPEDGGNAAGCDYGGKRYAPGDNFSSTDGCNTCLCSSNGSVACTEKACLADAGTTKDAEVDAADGGYTCPPAGFVNCGLPVPPEKQELCSGPYHQWIKANCPDVQFVY